jgi:hypothetical protein
MDKKVATSMSPNITRTHKALDTGENGTHAFYMSMVEFGLSMSHPLQTNDTLRAHEQASAHYRFARPRTDGPMEYAGADPKQLATHDYAAVPLWRVDAKLGRTLDIAHEEAAANTMPMRRGPYQLNAHEVENLRNSLASLAKLDKHLQENDRVMGGEEGKQVHETLHMFSFASIVQNPNAIEAFVETVKETGNVMGKVRGLTHVVPGIAAYAGDDAKRRGEQLGRMITLTLFVPTTDT